jgi:hypothetical protein
LQVFHCHQFGGKILAYRLDRATRKAPPLTSFAGKKSVFRRIRAGKWRGLPLACR